MQANDAPSPPERRRPWMIALAALLLLISFLQSAALLSSGAVHGNDFKHLWAGARMIELGGNPYDPAQLKSFAALQGWIDDAGRPVINPYVYLPTTALLMRPLASLAYPHALAAWFWFNWLAAWLLVWTGPGLLRVGRPALARLAAAAFVAGAFPFYRQMTAGQMNIVACWLVLGGLAALLRRREGWAGALLGLGFAWKLAPALLILVLAAIRRWRGFFAGCGVAAALWIATLPFASLSTQRDALAVIGQMGYGRSTWAAEQRDYYRDPFNQAPNSLFHHLLTDNPYTQPWIELSPGAANGATIVFSLALAAVWIGRRRRLLDAGGEPELFLGALLLMLLLPSLMWDHYAVQTLPALIWIAGDRRTARSWPRVLGLAAIFAMLAWPWRHQYPEKLEGFDVLLMSFRLWPTLALYGWLMFDRPAAWAGSISLQANLPGPNAPGHSQAADYWAGILDPQNLEREQAPGGPSLDEEIRFADAPDLHAAADWLEAAKPENAPSVRFTLDLGAGLGANSFVLARRGHRVLAADTALGRLRELRRRAAQAGLPAASISAVVCAAEALPFVGGSIAGAYTKSVLIHTDLPQAASELARILPAGGRAALVEPQPGNPFAWLYRRTLAPKAWASITRYFDPEAQRDVLDPFSREASKSSIEPFYFLAFFAFVFQFAWPKPWLFEATLKPLMAMDALLFRTMPGAKRLAWFGAILIQKAAKSTAKSPPEL